MSSQSEEWSGLLFRALATPIGIVVRTDNPGRALEALRKTRNELVEPEVQALSFHRNPFAAEEEIFILRVRPPRGPKPADNSEELASEALAKVSIEDLDK